MSTTGSAGSGGSPIRFREDVLRPAAEGLRQNWRPMLLVQAVAVGLVVAYFRSPQVRGGAEALQEWRAGLGLGFPAMAGFVAGGVLPEIAKALTGMVRRFDGDWLREWVFRGLVWTLLAVGVDIFYVLQAQWFGTGNDAATLAKKTAVDMLIFAPIVFVPYTVAAFRWRAAKFKARAFFEAWTWAGWKRTVLPTWVPNFAFWAPVLLAVYALPTDLQYPLSALATACWSLLFVFLQHRQPE